MTNSFTQSLDAIDRRLLQILQADAGLTNEAIAQLAHVSPATSLRRVRRMEAAGLIQRRVALIDPDKVGPWLQSISEVVLDRQGAEHLDAFEERVVAHFAVQQCYRVSPGPDFIVIAVTRDVPSWAAVAATLFTQDANVRNVRTFFIIRRAKFEPAMPLDERDDGARGRPSP
jgi:DNA-binding Lrp family transcriptional regulator